jgi:hypothetical protein
MVGQGVVLKALSDGHKVIGLDIGPDSLISADDLGSAEAYVYHQLDATDYSAYYKIIKDEGCNAIIHLAATFNKFGDDGELLTHVPSHVRLVFLPVLLPLLFNYNTVYRLRFDRISFT